MGVNAGVTIVGIYGSPRVGGNTDTLLNAVLKGAEEGGAAAQRIYLRDLNFVPCQNCGGCAKTGQCHIKDNMGVVYEALDSSDLIVLAAPIYFCSVSAQAKAMIDRCQPYWARKYVLKQKPPRGGRKGGFVCCCGFKDDRFRACTEEIIKSWYYIMGVDYRGCCFIPGLDARNDAANHPDATTGALEYGKGLTREAGDH